MIYEVFSVYDTKAQAYLPPFILPRVEQAQRIFADCINSDDHQFGKHPDDYTLFQLGQFDDDSGKFLTQRNGKVSLGNGIEYIAPEFTPQLEQKGNGKVSDGAPVLSGAESGNSPE